MELPSDDRSARLCLVQMGGTTAKALRAGLELTKKIRVGGRALDHVFVVSDPSTGTDDRKTQSPDAAAQALAKLIQAAKLGPKVTRVRIEPLKGQGRTCSGAPEAGADAHGIEAARIRVRDPSGRFEAWLAAQRSTKSHFIVSTESGTPAQWMALVERFEEEGVETSLVRLRQGRAEVLPVSAARDAAMTFSAIPEDPYLQLRFLERLPPGSSVLLTGDPGSGKTERARQIHARWAALHPDVAENRFLHLNCAAIPEELLESELFGHLKGSHSGASKDRKGIFHEADGGTLMLDEIGEMSTQLQAKLLLVLDSAPSGGSHRGQRGFRRLGSTELEWVRARLIFATNRNLELAVQEGRFRKDLFDRISTYRIELPPLVETRHRALSAYLSRLWDLYPDYGYQALRFHADSQELLLDFILSEQALWTGNYRDVTQSAHRLLARAAMAADASSSKKGSKAQKRFLYIHPAVVAAEIAELRGRWARTREGPDEWQALREALAPGSIETLSELERYEARFLLEAWKATGSMSEAWLHLRANNRVPSGKSGSEPKNASDAFRKRWTKFRWSTGLDLR